ncbi:Acetyl-CoA synthetase (ADP-forming) alpha and beta chains, putative, partial [hydrothermal vent metagenome]
ADIASGEAILNQANIPTFAFPDTAARVFQYMWRYQKRLESLYETPFLPEETEKSSQKIAEISQMINDVRANGRIILTEYESKQVLAAYDIPTVDTRLAKTAVESVEIAELIGYPVVLKLNSETITHKTDVGGVRLDLATASEVRHAFTTMAQAVTAKYSTADFLGVTVQPMLTLNEGYELIIGASPDLQFGPVLLFGTGGTLVEVFKDRALGLPPLTTTLARRMMERTKIYKALQGVRGRDPVDLEALEALLVRFGQLVVEQKWIKEIDINPLFASSDKLIALDARVVLYEPEVTEDKLPQLAIRPYPTQYIKTFPTKQGVPLIIRPIRPEDEPMMVKFHETLSERSVYLRYFRAFQLDQRVEHERLIRICFVDYDRDMALVVLHKNEESGEDEIIAAGRLTKSRGEDEAEFSMLVSDAHQGQGIGTQMLTHLLEVGKQEGVKRVVAYLMPENSGMRTICQRLGFQLALEAGLVKATIELE